ncbi:MAG: TraB/GumN family protein [Ferrimonas sp.]
MRIALPTLKRVLFFWALGISLCQPTIAWGESTPATPLFYQLQLGQQQGWLLGTIHVGQADFYPLSARIERAIDRAQGLVLEADPQDPTLPQLLAQYAMARQPLPSEFAEQVRHFCQQQHFYCDTTLAPWLLSSQIALGQMQQAGYEPRYGVELYLQQRLPQRPIYELEGMAAQLMIFNQLSEAANHALLRASLQQSPVHPMIKAWRSGDAHALLAFIEAEMAHPELQQHLLWQRNQTMANGIERLLHEHQGLLFAIGAAHLVGEESVVSQLQAQGISVIPIID